MLDSWTSLDPRLRNEDFLKTPFGYQTFETMGPKKLDIPRIIMLEEEIREIV